MRTDIDEMRMRCTADDVVGRFIPLAEMTSGDSLLVMCVTTPLITLIHSPINPMRLMLHRRK